MNISKLVNIIWNNSIETQFSSSEPDSSATWEEDIFLKSWFERKNMLQLDKGKSPGWYWFICKISYEEICKLDKPATLPAAGCDFGETANENKKIFGEKMLCKPKADGVVIYNGHEGDVIARIRAHFNLNNDRTGALGIKHYPLRSKAWAVRIFTENLIRTLPVSEQAQGQITSLINNRTGRCAIESAWRTNHGWPVLCKQ